MAANDLSVFTGEDENYYTEVFQKNTKKPIFSVYGGKDYFISRLKNYAESIGNATLTVKEHISKSDMEEWLESVGFTRVIETGPEKIFWYEWRNSNEVGVTLDKHSCYVGTLHEGCKGNFVEDFYDRDRLYYEDEEKTKENILKRGLRDKDQRGALK